MPNQKLAELLDSQDLTEPEKHVIRWQFGRLGDFQGSLMHTIARADDENMRRLACSFPLQVSAFAAWTKGGLGEKLRGMGLEI